MRWMNLEPIIQSEVSQKEKNKYHILTHIYKIYERWYQRMYLQGSNGERHREQTYVHGERGRECEMYGESNMETYITIYKRDRQQGICCMSQETQIGALHQPREVEDGREIQEGEDIYIAYSKAETLLCQQRFV